MQSWLEYTRPFSAMIDDRVDAADSWAANFLT
jgi:hypothetical protein